MLFDVSEELITPSSGSKISRAINQRVASAKAEIWTSAPTRATLRYIPEDGDIHNYHCESLKFYKMMILPNVMVR
jgi:hypothetical protein